MSEIVLVERFPGVDDYLRVRAAAGMHAKSREAAERALPNTLVRRAVWSATVRWSAWGG